MKTKILTLTLVSLWSIVNVFAQDRTTVTATNSDISDNLDLRAVASIFGDSQDLADFERRLNDPKAQISNLDLNGDNQVDYLRVIESVEGNAHLIIIQSVLGRETFQDIATLEVERGRNNQVQVQVVGDVYMYGNNYIYEPVYSYAPPIYTYFWVGNYRPYYSSWYWGFYPSYYSFWAPYPLYTYNNNIHVHINSHHHYNYVNSRRNTVLYANYYNSRRQNGYERQNPNRSFSQRNQGYSNRRELNNSRNSQTNSRNQTTTTGGRNNSGALGSTRSKNGFRNETNTIPGSTRAPRSTSISGSTRTTESPRTLSTQNGSRSTTTQSTPRTSVSQRAAAPQRNDASSNRSYTRAEVSTRSNETPRVQTQRSSGSSQAATPRTSTSQNDESSNSGRR